MFPDVSNDFFLVFLANLPAFARLACIWAMTLQLAEVDKPRWIDDIQEIDNAWNIKTVESLAP